MPNCFSRQRSQTVTILKGVALVTSLTVTASVVRLLENQSEVKMSELDVSSQSPSEAEDSARSEADSQAEAQKKKTARAAVERSKPPENKIVRLLEKNPLGLTLPEMAGGPRQVKKIRMLRPLLAEAIRSGLVMPVSQRAGNTVYRLVKYLGPR